MHTGHAHKFVESIVSEDFRIVFEVVKFQYQKYCYLTIAEN